MVDHSTRDHAVLSASASSRWLQCTPSARLEQKAKKDSTSIYAEEGTLAHELADIRLQHILDQISTKVYVSEVEKVKTKVLKLFDNDDTVWDEMQNQTGKFVDIVVEAIEVANKKKGDATVLLEQRLDFSHAVPDGFGTGDVVIIADGVMEIIDLKYGRGVKVDAKTNSQLMLYGLGALRAHDLSYHITHVKHTIVQPRLDHYDTWQCTVGYLTRWADRVLIPKAKLAFEGEGKKKAGDHCKFCKVKALCKTFGQHNLKLAKYDFKDPDLFTIEELAGIYGQAGMLLDWVNAIAKYLTDQAMEGNSVPGYKLVEGRSTRKWSDPKKVYEILDKEFIVSDFEKTTLQGIPFFEKTLGKEDFAEYFAPLVLRPPGKPTMVPLSDKRPALGVEQAKEDFKDDLL